MKKNGAHRLFLYHSAFAKATSDKVKELLNSYKITDFFFHLIFHMKKRNAYNKPGSKKLLDTTQRIRQENWCAVFLPCHQKHMPSAIASVMVFGCGRSQHSAALYLLAHLPWLLHISATCRGPAALSI
jgi:hypothetical protein